MKAGDKVTVFNGPFETPGVVLRVTATQVIIQDETFMPKRFYLKTRKIVGGSKFRCTFTEAKP